MPNAAQSQTLNCNEFRTKSFKLVYSPSCILKGLVIQYSINFCGNFSITGVGIRTTEYGFKAQTAVNPNEHFTQEFWISVPGSMLGSVRKDDDS